MQDSREPSSHGDSTRITREQQEELLQEAKEAAVSGNLGKMLEALYQSQILDGLSRQIASKWPSLSFDEIGDIVAEAVDILYVAIRTDKKVLNLVAYLWKTSDYKAHEYHRVRQNQRYLTPNDLERIPDQARELEDDFDSLTKKQDWEEKRPRVIAIVRSLLPRLGQHNVQKVMTYILDALEANCMDISNAEIAEGLGLSLDVVRQSKHRGFQRLERIVREESLATKLNDFANLRLDYQEKSKT